MELRRKIVKSFNGKKTRKDFSPKKRRNFLPGTKNYENLERIK